MNEEKLLRQFNEVQNVRKREEKGMGYDQQVTIAILNNHAEDIDFNRFLIKIALVLTIVNNLILIAVVLS